MTILRWTLLGAAIYGLFRQFRNSAIGRAGPAIAQRTDEPRHPGEKSHESAGLAATFFTREAADLAIEHLVQQHGVDRTAIFVEAVGDDNSTGKTQSGGMQPPLAKRSGLTLP